MPTQDSPAYLAPLNDEQRRAVLHTGKPLLILAGAGSGKTRVITTKIAWLIREQGLDPRSILAVTFTNKAAREMAERARQIEERAGDAMLRTFHSFGAWFLRRNGSHAGLNSDFVIYDDDDVISLLSGMLENTPKPEIKLIAHNISRAKDYFLSPDDPELAMIDHQKRFRSVYARYEERMAQIGNVDFGDLIKKPVEILRSQPVVAQRFRDRFSVIMVDEYQDANVAQFQLLKELCGPSTYVCVVGDDDQSIYRFRGAEVKNILEFPSRFSGADIIRLEQNYRSTSPILNAASSVVDCNRGRLGKKLRSEKGDGPLPVLAYLSNQDAEAEFCAGKIQNSVKKKETNWSDWAILYRTNAQSLGFETHFLKKGIPYRVVGSLKFYEREEIKDALALLSILVNHRDEVAFRRIVNKPARGIGPVTIHKIIETSIINNKNLLETIQHQNEEGGFSQKARAGLNTFLNVIKNAESCLQSETMESVPPTPDSPLPTPHDKKGNKPKAKTYSEKGGKSNRLKSGKGLSVLVEKLLIDSGIAEYHETQDEISGNSKTGNLQELLNAATDYPNTREGLLEFLENIELDRSMEENSGNQNANAALAAQNAVTLITFHNTKGLEFKRVIMTGLEQGIFPREEKKGDELEEERRLFYVGATRAMDELYFTTCRERRMYGKTSFMEPSLFLREIDKKCFKTEKEQFNPNSHYAANFPAQSGSRQFFPNQRVNSQFAAPASQQSDRQLEERCGWRRGQRVYNDSHGYGAVMSVKDSEDGHIVHVRFDNGQDKLFLSEIQGRAYEKIGED